MTENNIMIVQNRRWRCLKGHEWEETWKSPAPISFALGHDLEIGPMCPYCLHERLVELLAVVSPVEEVRC